MTEARYLPILQEDGSLIPRPRLMIFFASLIPNLTRIEQVYNAAINEELLYPTAANSEDPGTLSFPSRTFFDEIHSSGNMRARLMAGQTVLEWARRKEVFGRVVGLDQTKDEVAKHQRQFFIERKPQRKHVGLTLRTMHRNLKRFEPVLHFAALQFLDRDIFINAEKRFTDIEILGMAKTLENLVDEVMSPEGKGRGWNPIRVPAIIEARPLPEFDADQLSALRQSEVEAGRS